MDTKYYLLVISIYKYLYFQRCNDILVTPLCYYIGYGYTSYISLVNGYPSSSSRIEVSFDFICQVSVLIIFLVFYMVIVKTTTLPEK